MKNLKSVAVAVVLGSLLCSGGLAVAATSSTIQITLYNDTGLTLYLEQDGAVLNGANNVSQCDAHSEVACIYQGEPGKTYTVTDLKSSKLWLGTLKESSNVNCSNKKDGLACIVSLLT